MSKGYLDKDLSRHFGLEVLSNLIAYPTVHVARLESDLRAMESKATGLVAVISVLIAVTIFLASMAELKYCIKIVLAFSLMASLVNVICAYGAIKSRIIAAIPNPAEISEKVFEIAEMHLKAQYIDLSEIENSIKDLSNQYSLGISGLESAIASKKKWIDRQQLSFLISVVTLLIAVLFLVIF